MASGEKSRFSYEAEERFHLRRVAAPANDMVIVDGIGQEIGKIIQGHLDLRAAEHVAESHIFDASFLDKIPGQVPFAFVQGAVPLGKRALNRHTDAGFKMGVQGEAF